MKIKNTNLILMGIGAFSIALVLNLRHAANDYGILDNKLHMEVLAQTNTSGSGSGSGSDSGDNSGGGSSSGNNSGDGSGSGNNETVKMLPKKVSQLTCEISGTLSHTKENNQSSSTKWGFTGDFKAGGKLVGLDLNADFDSKDDAGSSIFNTGSFTINVSFTSDLIECQQQKVGECTPYDPCIERLKAYRSLMK